jgi:hypothetical protein
MVLFAVVQVAPHKIKYFSLNGTNLQAVIFLLTQFL